MTGAEYIRINPADNVAVALAPLAAGSAITVDGERLTLSENIPTGHKFALRDIAVDEDVIKYGYPIGHATTPIARGGWANETNIRTNLEGVLEYTWNPKGAAPGAGAAEGAGAADGPATFMGYRRANGGVGIRNELWIIPTVGCVNGTAANLVRLMQQEIGRRGERAGERLRSTANRHQAEGRRACSNGRGAKEEGGARSTFSAARQDNSGGVDAIAAWPHNYGCSQLGEDHENTRHMLADLALHPNCGGALVLGLGCENNQIAAFRKLLEEQGADMSRVRFLETQKVAGDETQAAMALLRELFRIMQCDVRTSVPVSELRVGLKCGGSDGLSGITANPLLGLFSDWLIARGGTAVLTEVPEMFGAETILMERCRDRATFDKTVRLINDFKEYFIANGQPVYENPSPGNKAGGISTLEEKSLGCTQKCGGSPVEDVLSYGQRLRVRGLSLLSSPGNDLVSSTALAAAGCHMVLFTTGRGTPFGTCVPTVKISTNSALAQNKPHWIDFDAGRLLSGATSEEMLKAFISCVIDVADGHPVNNEKNGMREIAIFKTGVTA